MQHTHYIAMWLSVTRSQDTPWLTFTELYSVNHTGPTADIDIITSNGMESVTTHTAKVTHESRHDNSSHTEEPAKWLQGPQGHTVRRSNVTPLKSVGDR